MSGVAEPETRRRGGAPGGRNRSGREKHQDVRVRIHVERGEPQRDPEGFAGRVEAPRIDRHLIIVGRERNRFEPALPEEPGRRERGDRRAEVVRFGLPVDLDRDALPDQQIRDHPRETVGGFKVSVRPLPGEGIHPVAGRKRSVDETTGEKLDLVERLLFRSEKLQEEEGRADALRTGFRGERGGGFGGRRSGASFGSAGRISLFGLKNGLGLKFGGVFGTGRRRLRRTRTDAREEG